MRYEIESDFSAVPNAIPPMVAMTDRAIAGMRRYLQTRSLAGYQVFHSGEIDIDEIDRYLNDIGEGAAHWEAISAAVPGLEALDVFIGREADGELRRSGVLHLPGHEIVMLRWNWANPQDPISPSLTLFAAPSFKHFLDLRQELRAVRRDRAASVWQVVSGPTWRDSPRVPRVTIDPDQDLILPDALRNRIEVDVIQFVDESVSRMYLALKVPYRRGVLMHGPPGNGKTTIIRLIGSRLPDVPAMILRPVGAFEGDDLRTVIRRWTKQSPAILVIEDLNWLLKKIDLSLFLNLLDGIEAPNTGGLMLLATTNHPDQLDPALNNRPGRFDVVIEVSCPDEALRRKFLMNKLDAETPPDLIDRLVRQMDGLSFAHHQELLRLSGLLAINAGRTRRGEADLLAAAGMILESYEDATRGFVPEPALKFGFHQLHRRRNG